MIRFLVEQAYLQMNGQATPERTQTFRGTYSYLSELQNGETKPDEECPDHAAGSGHSHQLEGG